MLSKEDLGEYLKQISDIEDFMFYVYRTCFDKADDVHIKTICNSMSKAEAKHHLLVERLKKLLQQ